MDDTRAAVLVQRLCCFKNCNILHLHSVLITAASMCFSCRPSCNPAVASRCHICMFNRTEGFRQGSRCFAHRTMYNCCYCLATFDLPQAAAVAHQFIVALLLLAWLMHAACVPCCSGYCCCNNLFCAHLCVQGCVWGFDVCHHTPTVGSGLHPPLASPGPHNLCMQRSTDALHHQSQSLTVKSRIAWPCWMQDNNYIIRPLPLFLTHPLTHAHTNTQAALSSQGGKSARTHFVTSACSSGDCLQPAASVNNVQCTGHTAAKHEHYSYISNGLTRSWSAPSAGWLWCTAV